MGVLAHSTDGRRWRPGHGGRCRAGVVPRAAGRDIDDAALAHIWPARHENFYFHGTHSVNVDSELAKLDADGTGRGIPVAVVAPAPESGQLVTKLNLIPSAPLHATAAGSKAAARRLIGEESVSAALVINPAATTDTLLVASADGSSEASAVEQVITAAEASQHRSVTVTVTDIVSDARSRA